MGLAKQQHLHDQQAFEDEEAAAAEVAAELAQEMPASARPGCITPTLGSGRLGTIPKPPAQPSCILSLDMGAVAAAREAEAHAVAAAAAAPAAVAAAATTVATMPAAMTTTTSSR